MELFRGQRILVVSPQPWGHIRLSKHHYAMELARQGNEVFFLGPPEEAIRGVVVEFPDDSSGVKVIRYRSSVPLALRFHARPVFNAIQRREIAKIKRVTGPIDVVWCFDFNVFADLRNFGAPVKIFHPVDPVSSRSHIDVARTADAVFSVSRRILSSFDSILVPRFVIDHGLTRAFADHASRPVRAAARTGGPYKVGYVGNLARPPLDRVALTRMVEENARTEFHFWGPVQVLPDESDEFKAISSAFIEFLEKAPNVYLRGTVSPDEVASQIQEMDCFVLAYLGGSTDYDLSNSHKILEYLSTGKAVVSSRIDSYVGREGLLEMPDAGDNSSLPEILKQTLARLDELNAPAAQQRRREFALDNTYERQIDRIRDMLATVATLRP